MAALQPREPRELGALNRAYTNRHLLPSEVQLCNALGISEDDYFYFCQLAEAHGKERDTAYELVPDVRAELVSVITSIAIGVALSAVSYLLTPKPRMAPAQQQQGTTIQTESVQGQTKFASLYGFDSLQDLAELGSVLPLVFANRNSTTGIGGIRAKAMLIWSQMLSKGSQQEFKALFTFGLGLLAQPDMEGFALGDQLLKNYSRERFALYFRANGGRISEGTNRVANTLLPGQGYDDVFLARDELAPSKQSPLFSGARTPSSQTTFGCYAPISNGSPYWVPYDLILINNEFDRVKQDKMYRPWCGRQAMSRLNNIPRSANTYQINPNDTLTFEISAANEDPNAYAPHGLADVNNAIVDRHNFADESISIGDTYLFGSALIECIGTSTDAIWQPGSAKSYVFRCLEAGAGYFLPADHDPLQVGNVPYGQHLQRVSLAVITNNRKCDQTEIGIKSTVWKRLTNFANVNSEPDNAAIDAYVKGGNTISLGRVNRYITRYSFFKVQARAVGSSATAAWNDISSGQIFAVRGDSPQPQYNALRIVHPFGEYEFRIVPVPGAVVFGSYIGNPVHLLTGSGFGIISAGQFYIAYTGQRIILSADAASNPEFVRGGRTSVGGIVNGLTPTTVGQLPPVSGTTFIGRAIDYDAVARTIKYGIWINQANAALIRAFWDSVDVSSQLSPTGEYRQGPAYGVIPPKLEWKRSGTERLSLTSPAYYYEVDSVGRFVGAVWNNINVNTQTQQGQDEVQTAIYRRGTQYTAVQGTTSLINDPTTPPQYNPYTAGAYFGVWQVRGQADSTRRAFWNGVEVPLNVLTQVVPGQVGRYIVGNKRDYFPSINCDVYEIIRQIQTTTGSTRYFYAIEPGAYTVIEAGWDVFYIDKYRSNIADLPFVFPPADYAVSGGSGAGLIINASSYATGQWQWLLRNGGAGYKQGETVTVTFPDGTNVSMTVGVTTATGVVVQAQNLNPLDAIADYWKYDEEQTSHADSPEHEIVYVNEQVRQSTAPQYPDMALTGLRLLAGKDWTSLGQLTAYCKQGITVERLVTDSGSPTTSLRAPTNNFPEIAYNLLVDPRIGAGQKISRNSVDRDAMTIAAHFCRANGFTWDGVLGDRVNLREWIFQQAAYCLLDFTIVGGRFSLLPSVPYNPTTFVIAPAQPVPIAALFTDGNIRNLNVTWLSPEERRLFQAVVTYREEVENGFSTNRTMRVRLSDSFGGSELDPEEVFDLTTFCTNPVQAQTFAQHALLLRKEVDHSVTFETTPSAAAFLTPGSYIKLISEATHTSRLNNGSIDADGHIVSTTLLQDGTYSVLMWKPGSTSVTTESLTVLDGKTANSKLFGSVFTLSTTTTEKRVYKVETVSVREEGFVEITGTHQPIASNGGLATIQFDPTHFKVES